MSFSRRLIVCIAASMLVCPLAATPNVASANDGRDNGQMIGLVRPLAEANRESIIQVRSGDRPVGLGTIVDPRGYVLTKRSELNGDPIRVRLADGRFLPARVAAVRRHNDLALLKIEADEVDFKPIQFVDDETKVASFLVSVGRTGRPIGLGVVGSPERKLGHTGRLGVVLENDSQGRALVQMVWPQSGAAAAGIEPGDRIVAINGREENSRNGVIDTLRGMFPGEIVKLTILRPNEAKQLVTMEMNAGIREFELMNETENDSKINGPRNVRLSGFDLVIQHDTVLDPDECGGPVLDLLGRAVGLNIARAGRVVSYALPGSLVKKELASMMDEVAPEKE